MATGSGQIGGAARAGALAGAGLGMIALVAAAILLLRPSDSSYKALIAVWLWALPALGLFGAAGWLGGWALERAWRAADIGSRLERWLDRAEAWAVRTRLAALGLGVGLALAVLAGGVAALIAVWALLVGVSR